MHSPLNKACETLTAADAFSSPTPLLPRLIPSKMDAKPRTPRVNSKQNKKKEREEQRKGRKAKES